MSIKNYDYYNFLNITKDIIFDEDFKKLKKEKHHGNNNRYDHSLRVALNVYKICKNKNIDYISATRGALLHDFFLTEEVGYKMREELVNHPDIAVTKSINKFNINNHEQNIIKTHMFPITREFPNSKEAILVSVVDKAVALKEICKYILLRLKSNNLEIDEINFDKNKLKEKEVLSVSININSKEEFYDLITL